MLSRILKIILIIALLVGLFAIGAIVFFVVISFLAIFSVVAWLRKKGIIADKRGAGNFKEYTEQQTSDIVIDGDFHEVDEVKTELEHKE